MTITIWLNASLQFLIKLATSDMFLFIVLAMSMLALYGIVTIIMHIIFIHVR